MNDDEIIRLATGKKHITTDSVLYLTMNHAIEEARADERKQLADRMKIIDAQTKSLPQTIQDDTEFITKLKKEAVQETFSLLDYIAQTEHGTDLESCLFNGRSKDSQRILRKFKKEMGIE